MRIERLTYVTENGEILFHPDGYPSDKGLTIKQLAKNKRWKILNKIARRLANYEQSDNIKQSIKLSNDIILYYIDFIWSNTMDIVMNVTIVTTMDVVVRKNTI